MTIRLAMTAPIETGREEQGIVVYDDRGFTIAECDTREEAEQAKRAFENVLAPRFTRDEAIAIVQKALACVGMPANAKDAEAQLAMLHGARLTLEALAAAGVFVDHEADNVLHAAWLRDKLDAAGIR